MTARIAGTTTPNPRDCVFECHMRRSPGVASVATDRELSKDCKEQAVQNGDTGEAAGQAVIEIRVVEMDRPWFWLAAGWRDFMRAPVVSIVYGLVFSLAGYLLTYWLYATDKLYLVLPLAAGFTLVGPVAAVGLYDVSRRLETGRPVGLGHAAASFISHAGTVAAMGLVLMLFLLAWIRIALLVFALFFGEQPATVDGFIETVFFAPESLPFVVTGTAIGAVLAATVFAISAISLPMLLDRDVGLPMAIGASLRVVKTNFQAMALWAALIAGFTALGIATLYVGLVVCLPLIGYASWHAYRDMIELGDSAPA